MIGVHRRADLDRRAEHVAPAAVLRLPHRVAQHGDRRAGRRLILGLGEVAAERRRRVEEAEEVRAHDADAHLARGVADADGQVALRVAGDARRTSASSFAKSLVARVLAAAESRAPSRGTSGTGRRGARCPGPS